MLKTLYEKHFRIGVACERINGKFTRHEIGNPDKENLIAKEFNSMTCANELKPAYNMGFASPDATEEYLPFVINPQAKDMLEFAKSHGLKLRGHVLVWHSQCPKEVFCKNYTPVTFPTDPEELKEKPFLKHFEKLNPICYVDRQTMLKRLESYIFSVMEYMYQNGYANIIYAWDVVNEAIELQDKQPTGLRNSYWYQVIGDDFIYWAFRFAKNAVVTMSKRFASLYNVDPENEENLKSIQPSLFYNDYNEWHAEKKAAILGILGRETNEHGSVFSEKLIDGIGMQGHVSDNNNIEEYIAALREYATYVNEVHITELDVKCTCVNINAEYYQAVFYKKLFEELIKAKKEGVNITSVTVWGLTDDNSWIRGANPLLFHGDLSEKLAYKGLEYAITGESLGDPLPIVYDIKDRHFDFAPNADGSLFEPEKHGFKMKGFSQVKVQDKEVHSGSYAIAHDVRFDNWSAVCFDVSDFIGQTVSVSAWVKTPGKRVEIYADIEGVFPTVAGVDMTANEWTQLSGVYKIPNDLHSLFMAFRVIDEKDGVYSPLYMDDIEVKLIGMQESFEEEKNCAAIRGMGHLPVLFVTDKESVDGKGHSLCVTRQEKDATMKFNVSPYIGNKISVTAYVKTKDNTIYMGLDGAVSEVLCEVPSLGEWTKVCATVDLSGDRNSAEIFISTNGNADYFIDDIFVTICKD